MRNTFVVHCSLSLLPAIIVTYCPVLFSLLIIASCHYYRSLLSIIIICHCFLSLFYVIAFCHYYLSQFYVIVIYHCFFPIIIIGHYYLSLFCVIVICHCFLSFFYVIAICHCYMSLFSCHYYVSILSLFVFCYYYLSLLAVIVFCHYYLIIICHCFLSLLSVIVFFYLLLPDSYNYTWFLAYEQMIAVTEVFMPIMVIRPSVVSVSFTTRLMYLCLPYTHIHVLGKAYSLLFHSCRLSDRSVSLT